jgi:hypothetical protein
MGPVLKRPVVAVSVKRLDVATRASYYLDVISSDGKESNELTSRLEPLTCSHYE